MATIGMKTRKEAEAVAKEIRRALRGCRLTRFTAACEVKKIKYPWGEVNYYCSVCVKSRDGYTTLSAAQEVAADIAAAVPYAACEWDPMIFPVRNTVVLYFDYH